MGCFPNLGCLREAAIKLSLSEKGINSIIYYPIPIHAQIAYKNAEYDRSSLIHTEKACTEVLSLPMFPEITYDEQIYITDNLNNILKENIKEAKYQHKVL